eukprot:CAMPEP_0184715254 /NCGR_PEP_ID=MMETSP0314-20130426/5219_1 /TAXON_ID=38298 /ORGANISM="Rhodella maculata, Strain CCMP 736" /LENGTH=272 /DNA_ID=CAMNT_0027178347 /DNA_START=91 /DNA_END=912 /DNA_ORIENTATION=+
MSGPSLAVGALNYGGELAPELPPGLPPALPPKVLGLPQEMPPDMDPCLELFLVEFLGGTSSFSRLHAIWIVWACSTASSQVAAERDNVIQLVYERKKLTYLEEIRCPVFLQEGRAFRPERLLFISFPRSLRHRIALNALLFGHLTVILDDTCAILHPKPEGRGSSRLRIVCKATQIQAPPLKQLGEGRAGVRKMLVGSGGAGVCLGGIVQAFYGKGECVVKRRGAGYSCCSLLGGGPGARRSSGRGERGVLRGKSEMRYLGEGSDGGVGVDV